MSTRKERKLRMSNPITGRANQLISFFADDDGITTKFVFPKHTLSIYAEDKMRAVALSQVLKPVIKLGKLRLDIAVYYRANGKNTLIPHKDVKCSSEDRCELLGIALMNNPNVSRFVKAEMKLTHIVWWFMLTTKSVCQYLNDDIQNPWSTTTCLPEDVVKFFFLHKGVQISTDIEDYEPDFEVLECDCDCDCDCCRMASEKKPAKKSPKAKKAKK